MSARTAQSAGQQLGQYLVFSVSGQELAVPLERVSEIVPYERVSAVPGAPAWVRGVAHVRGRVIPVVDLAVKLARTPEPAGKRTCILMFELTRDAQPLVVGVVMDSVAKLIDVDCAQIEPPPRFDGAAARTGVQPAARSLLAGLVPAEHGMLPLLDVGQVFEPSELAEVAATTRASERR